MNLTISVIIPNHNGAATIGLCLEAALASKYGAFEVIVVDDCSTDNSVEIINRYPCKLVRLPRHAGTSIARNTGAADAQGEILFFTDADCLLQENTLAEVGRCFREKEGRMIIGGTYTAKPYDQGFFNMFQSVFVHYAELKKADDPDYVAAHAMAVCSRIFRNSGGFPEDFLPIIEDIEFSHRLKRHGYRLHIDPVIQVRHIFAFSLLGSMKNAFVKTREWTVYSLANRDLLVDSGCASLELKCNALAFVVTLIVFFTLFFSQSVSGFYFLLLTPTLINLLINRNFLTLLQTTGGILYAFFAGFYYLFVYPLAVVIGCLAGIGKYPSYRTLPHYCPRGLLVGKNTVSD